jgi:hypothetical protein
MMSGPRLVLLMVLSVCVLRYASLYFIFCTDNTDNELITLEVLITSTPFKLMVQPCTLLFTSPMGVHQQIMHLLVRALDRYFDSVCELDLIYEFERVRTLLC